MCSEDDQDPSAQFLVGGMVGRAALVLLALLRGPHWVPQTQNYLYPIRDISKQMHSGRVVMVLRSQRRIKNIKNVIKISLVQQNFAPNLLKRIQPLSS